MDMFGTVDPYAILLFEQLEHRTETLKSTYTPEWNQTFTFVFSDCSKPVRTDLALRVKDWDATSKDDEVGSFTIPASRMSEIVRAAIGSDATDTFNLYLDGKVVVGHDKEPSEVTVRVRVTEVPKAFAALEMEEGAKGARRLDVTLLSAKHLPKVCVCSQFYVSFSPRHGISQPVWLPLLTFYCTCFLNAWSLASQIGFLLTR
jgi:Ca2+-dependent lipid-binding protein